MRRGIALLALLAMQVACTLFFVADILSSRVNLLPGPLTWEVREILEIAAAVGLVIGLVMGVIQFRRMLGERDLAQERLRRASGAFMVLLEERFGEWGLTPAERDVALFAIKGMSTAEIAALRATSEGTVKAQTNAIYRKAGVTGRSQLLSLFIDDLMRDEGALRPALPQSAA